MDVFRKVDRSKYSSDDMPEYPARVLASHVTIRGMQVGAFAGLGVAPIMARVLKQPTRVIWMAYMPTFTFVGGLVAAGFVFSEHWTNVDGVDDRAYRLYNNRNQTKVDVYSVGGCACGAIVGALAGRGNHKAMLSFGYTGLALGVVAYVVEKEYNKRFGGGGGEASL